MQTDSQNGRLNFRNAAAVGAGAGHLAPTLSLSHRAAPTREDHPRTGAELTIVVPTYSERDNIAELVLLLSRTLDGIDWEVVFVDDDSPDEGTPDLDDFATSRPEDDAVDKDEE